MNANNPSDRTTNPGVANSETTKHVRQLQADMLNLLKQSAVDPDRYAGLDGCRLNHCARVNCLEACPFGGLRRRLSDARATISLLRDAGPPFCEIRVSRAVWSLPFGKLKEANTAAAGKLIRRALDCLYKAGIVAVGTFKVAPSPQHQQQRWICEVHLIVAGANKDKLVRVFSTRLMRGEIRSRQVQIFLDYLKAEQVEALGGAVNRVLRSELTGWQHPWRSEIDPEPPDKARRREFYRWLLHLTPRARLIRYGCDQHFTKLKKKRRKRPPPRKPRRPGYPEWLRPYFFGSELRERNRSDPNCANYKGPKPKKSRYPKRLRKYFYQEEKEDNRYFDDV